MFRRCSTGGILQTITVGGIGCYPCGSLVVLLASRLSDKPSMPLQSETSSIVPPANQSYPPFPLRQSELPTIVSPPIRVIHLVSPPTRVNHHYLSANQSRPPVCPRQSEVFTLLPPQMRVIYPRVSANQSSPPVAIRVRLLSLYLSSTPPRPLQS